MIKIVPTFETIFDDFDTELPPPTKMLITISHNGELLVPDPGNSDRGSGCCQDDPQVQAGRMGWDLFTLNWPVFGTLIEKNSWPARHGPWARWSIGRADPGGADDHRETCGNAMFERLYCQGQSDSIREGETIAKPMKEYSTASFHPVALLLWVSVFAAVGADVLYPGLAQVVNLDRWPTWPRLSVAAGTLLADEPSPRRRRPGGQHGRCRRRDGRA